MHNRHFALSIWYHIPMRIISGKVQEFVQLVYQLGTLDMLQLLGYLMYLIPGKIEFLIKKGLPETMLADHIDGFLPAIIRKRDLSILLIVDQLLFLQLLQHVIDRRRFYPQIGGQLISPDLSSTIPLRDPATALRQRP